MPGMKPSDVYALTGVADARLDPSGRLVAYQVSSIDADENEYRGAIWVASVDGSEPPRQFTAGVLRHAGASSCTIALSGTGLRIRDDGAGPVPNG